MHNPQNKPTTLALIEDLISLSTNLGETDQDYVEAQCLLLFDQLALSLRELVPSNDYQDMVLDTPDLRSLRAVIAQRFPRWGQYNTVMSVTDDVGATDLALGHAHDDLTDIIGELMTAQQAAGRYDWDQAQWLLLDGYYNFWRGPLRSLQLFVHYLDIEH